VVGQCRRARVTFASSHGLPACRRRRPPIRLSSRCAVRYARATEDARENEAGACLPSRLLRCLFCPRPRNSTRAARCVTMSMSTPLRAGSRCASDVRQEAGMSRHVCFVDSAAKARAFTRRTRRRKSRLERQWQQKVVQAKRNPCPQKAARIWWGERYGGSGCVELQGETGPPE